MPEPFTATDGGPQAQRLLVCAHGPTEDLRRARFGGTAALSHPDLIQPVTEPVARWLCGPEPACRETLTRWGVQAEPVAVLMGPNFGGWGGRTLDETAHADPEGLAAWMHDPAWTPPGGESLSALVDRVQPFIAGFSAEGWTGVVTNPLVVRALIVAALDTSGDLVGRIEVSPGGRALLTRPHRRASWRLRRLT